MELHLSSWRINTRGTQTWLTFTNSNYRVITTVGLGYCTIKASLAFAMTGPGFEFDLKSGTPFSESQEGLSVQIWKSISDDPNNDILI